MLRNKSAKNEIGIIIDTSRRPRKESESIRQESAQIIDTSQGLRKELKVIREESLQINDRSQKARISDNDNKPCDNEPCDNGNDKSMLQVTINVIDENKDIIKEHTTKNKSIKPEKEALIHKKKKVLDQVNLIAKIRYYYSKNINEISEIMNDLHDDLQLRHIELNKIKVLTDKSLDLASELCHSGNREWYCVIDNIDIINDKIDLVNEIGEVIDNYMADAYNIVDGINKSHNNDSYMMSQQKI